MQNGLPAAAMARLTEIELSGADVNTFAALARADRHAARLSAATDGDLDRSRRHRELRRPHGLGDELRAALVVDGTTWGALTLLRGGSGPTSRRPTPRSWPPWPLRSPTGCGARRSPRR